MLNRIFSTDSPKALKADKFGYINVIHYMAPSGAAGVGNLCPNASAGCIALCLGLTSIGHHYVTRAALVWTSAPCGLYSVAESLSAAQFCGPTAMSALTGIPIPAVEDAVLAHRAALGVRSSKSRKTPQARVYGMALDEFAPALERLGWRCVHVFKPVYKRECRTLLSMLRTVRGLDGPLVVIVTGHAIAVRDGYFVDTIFKTPTPLALCPYMRKRVTDVIALSVADAPAPQGA